MTRPIDVLGELSVTGEGGEQLRLDGQGDAITVTLPNLRAGRSLAKQTAGRLKRKELLGRLQKALRLADLTLQVHVAGTPVARLTPHSEASLLSRLLGLGAVELKPMALILAVFRR